MWSICKKWFISLVEKVFQNVGWNILSTAKVTQYSHIINIQPYSIGFCLISQLLYRQMKIRKINLHISTLFGIEKEETIIFNTCDKFSSQNHNAYTFKTNKMDECELQLLGFKYQNLRRHIQLREDGEVFRRPMMFIKSLVTQLVISG